MKDICGFTWVHLHIVHYIKTHNGASIVNSRTSLLLSLHKHTPELHQLSVLHTWSRALPHHDKNRHFVTEQSVQHTDW